VVAGLTVGEVMTGIVTMTVLPSSEEHEPGERMTVIKKEDEDGNRSKTVIHHDND
jgi:hypothetical protein